MMPYGKVVSPTLESSYFHHMFWNDGEVTQCMSPYPAPGEEALCACGHYTLYGFPIRRESDHSVRFYRPYRRPVAHR